MQGKIDKTESFKKIYDYARLSDVFLAAVARIAPDLSNLIQGDDLLFIFDAKPLEEYASTTVQYFATSSGKENVGTKKKPKFKTVVRQHKWHLWDALEGNVIKTEKEDPTGIIAIRITFNSNWNEPTGPQYGGHMLATTMHEVFLHAERAIPRIRVAIKMRKAQELERQDYKRIKNLSDRVWKAETREEHNVLARGGDEIFESRVRDFHRYLQEAHPDRAYADEFSQEVEQDRRMRAKDASNRGAQGLVYLGAEAFDDRDVQGIKAAARNALLAFARVERLCSTLVQKMLLDFDKIAWPPREVNDRFVYLELRKIRLKYQALQKKVIGAMSLAAMYGWSEAHVVKLAESGELDPDHIPDDTPNPMAMAFL